MTDSPRTPRETPAQYAERHRRAANDGRHDRVGELSASLEADVQRAYWSLSVAAATALADSAEHRGDEPFTPSGDHRPRLLAPRPVG